MNASDRLIAIYMLVCQELPALAMATQRMSNNGQPEFTDEEVLTIYYFGILEEKRAVKSIHRFIVEYWSAWFPTLPNYEAFNHRLGVLSGVLPLLIERLERRLPTTKCLMNVLLIDSMPIIMAHATRSDTAMVAREIADKGYCASKKLYYHGLKLHAVVTKAHSALPRMTALDITAASEHDVLALRRIAPLCAAADIYGDRGYFYHDLDQLQQQGTYLWTVIQRVKGSPALHVDERLFNTSVSRMRQPVESFFNWIEQKTGIQQASKVRSTKGLLVHVYARLAAAMIAIILNF